MALGNTNSLSTNFNVSPFYDDYDETDNYYRILFEPGLAVQARELTQMQTILQNQIDRLGEHIFQEGSMVRGGEAHYDRFYEYVRVQDFDSVLDEVTVSDFTGTTVVGQTSGVEALVINTNDGSEANTPFTKTLFVKYTKTGTDNVTNRFTADEILDAGGGTTCNTLATGTFTGYGSAVSINEGVVFAKDHFIRVSNSTIILDPYTANTSYRVGFTIDEQIVDSDTDTNLLDPARGAYNFNAPGASRLKLLPVLQKYDFTTESLPNFIEVMTIRDGILQSRRDKPQYSKIRDYIAQRTSDESGDYVVRGMSTRLREHLDDGTNQGVLTSGNGGDANKLVVQVEPGKAYVKGYDIERVASSQLVVDKGTATEDLEGVAIPTNYGNYVTVKEVAGFFDVDNHALVSLRDDSQQAVSNTGAYSSVAAFGTEIGTARVRALEYSSGAKGDSEALYNMYLYDINMSSKGFANVHGIYINNPAGEPDGFADTVLSGNTTSLSETAFNVGLFPIGVSNINTIRDTVSSVQTDFKFLQKFNVTIANNGTFSVVTDEAADIWPYAVGALNATQKNAGFTLVIDADQTSGADLTGGATFDITASTTTLSGTGGAFLTELNVGDRVVLSDQANAYTVTAVTDNNTAEVAAYRGTGITGAWTGSTNVTVRKVFEEGQVIDMSGNGGNGTARSITIDNATTASFDINEPLLATVDATVTVELTKNNGQEAEKTLRPDRFVHISTANNVGGTSGPWDLGFGDVFELQEVRVKTSTRFTSETEGTDVTEHFELDTGQTDNLYKHGLLKKKTGSTLTIGGTDVFLVKIKYFFHDHSLYRGYFSVDSYPVNDSSPSSSEIRTQEIPIYTSPTTGRSYSLRDCIDIRPRIVDTGVDSITLPGSDFDPATSTTIDDVTGGLHYSPPNEDFTMDLSYYLSRRDLLVINAAGRYQVIKGQPSLFPITPEQPGDTMALAKLFIAPFPSLPPATARTYERPDLSNEINQINNERYTMRDIGAIKSRVAKLEYYTSLNLLESKAKDLNISDVNGLDRFKNGIVVDNFTGHGVGNVFDADYSISIDPGAGELRPKFKIDSARLQYNDTNTSNINRNANDAILVVTGASGSFTNGEIITSGANQANLIYQATANTMYLERVVGDFTVSGTITGVSSGETATIHSVTTPTPGDLLTLPYVHKLAVEQTAASTTRNCAGGLYQWRGSIALMPSADYWIDTTVRPDVQANWLSNEDNWENLSAAWTSEWDAWSTRWFGSESLQTREEFDGRTNTITQTDREATFDITQTVARNIRPDGLPTSNIVRTGGTITDTNVVPFMRSIPINVSASGLKPNTKMFAFFDNENVTSYMTPTDSSFANTASEGSDVISDSNGNVFATFRLPNDSTLQFRVGSKIFRLSDNATNQTGFGQTITSAQAVFTSQGSTPEPEPVMVSIRPVTNLSQSTTQTSITNNTTNVTNITNITNVTNNIRNTQTRNNEDDGDGGDDPIAQTFMLDIPSVFKTDSPGAFLSKLDLFFASKDPALGVRIEIRELDASTEDMTGRIVPFGTVTLTSDQVNVSSDGSSPTVVTFPSPVYLLSNTYYAIAIIPIAGNPNYSAWVARIGDTDILTGNRITKQPNPGILFLSSNNRQWDQVQEEDLKFNVYVASFNTGVTGTLDTTNEILEQFTIADLTGEFNTINEPVNGETSLVLSGSLAGAAIGDGIVQGGSASGVGSANGIITDISGAPTYSVKWVTINPKFTDSETVYLFQAGANTGTSATLSSQSTPTGRVIHYDTVSTSNTFLHLANSSGTFAGDMIVTGQVSNNHARILELEDLAMHTMRPSLALFEPKDTTISFQGKFATGPTTQDSGFSNIFVNNNNRFSAVKYLLGRTDEVAGLPAGERSVQIRGTLNTSNPLLSPAVDIQHAGITFVENKINNDNTGENSSAGGNAESRYITRTVTLGENQDAEDLIVYLTAYTPSTSTVEVYYKILNVEDSDTLSDRSWIQMTVDPAARYPSDPENTEDFIEYSYTIPSGQLNQAGVVQYTNSNSVTFTGYKYFAIKIVLLSTNAANPPRVKDLRAIALQV